MDGTGTGGDPMVAGRKVQRRNGDGWSHPRARVEFVHKTDRHDKG